jgi:hypothetical protein
MDSDSLSVCSQVMDVQELLQLPSPVILQSVDGAIWFNVFSKKTNYDFVLYKVWFVELLCHFK